MSAIRIRRLCADPAPPLLMMLRLNFSYCTPDKIDEGIRRLGTVIKRRMAA